MFSKKTSKSVFHREKEHLETHWSTMFFHNWEKNTCDWEECNDTEISYQNFKVKLVLFCSPLSARTRRFLKTTEMSFFLCDNYIGRKKNN